MWMLRFVTTLVLIAYSVGSWEAPDVAHCYDCHYAPTGVVRDSSGEWKVSEQGGFPRCALTTAEDLMYVNKWSCQSGKCFLRRDGNGQVFRGCADSWNLPLGVDTNVSCEVQGYRDTVWWFCDGDLCNNHDINSDALCGPPPAPETKKERDPVKVPYDPPTEGYDAAAEAEAKAEPEVQHPEQDENHPPAAEPEHPANYYPKVDYGQGTSDQKEKKAKKDRNAVARPTRRPKPRLGTGVYYSRRTGQAVSPVPTHSPRTPRPHQPRKPAQARPNSYNPAIQDDYSRSAVTQAAKPLPTYRNTYELPAQRQTTPPVKQPQQRTISPAPQTTTNTRAPQETNTPFWWPWYYQSWYGGGHHYGHDHHYPWWGLYGLEEQQQPEPQPSKQYQPPVQQYQQPEYQQQSKRYQPAQQYEQPVEQYQPPRQYQQPFKQYQQPSKQYQQPSKQYQQPSQQYQQPSKQYQQPSKQYQQPSQQYQQPSKQYQQPSQQYQQPQQQYTTKRPSAATRIWATETQPQITTTYTQQNWLEQQPEESYYSYQDTDPPVAATYQTTAPRSYQIKYSTNDPYGGSEFEEENFVKPQPYYQGITRPAPEDYYEDQRTDADSWEASKKDFSRYIQSLGPRAWDSGIQDDYTANTHQHYSPADPNNPCDGYCLGNPSGLFADPTRTDRFIQCGSGMRHTEPCECCEVYYHHCAEGTSFDDLTKGCSQNANTSYEQREYKTLDTYEK